MQTLWQKCRHLCHDKVVCRQNTLVPVLRTGVSQRSHVSLQLFYTQGGLYYILKLGIDIFCFADEFRNAFGMIC